MRVYFLVMIDFFEEELGKTGLKIGIQWEVKLSWSFSSICMYIFDWRRWVSRVLAEINTSSSRMKCGDYDILVTYLHLLPTSRKKPTPSWRETKNVTQCSPRSDFGHFSSLPTHFTQSLCFLAQIFTQRDRNLAMLSNPIKSTGMVSQNEENCARTDLCSFLKETKPISTTITIKLSLTIYKKYY